MTQPALSRMLVVDDDEAIRTYVTMVLEEEGFTVAAFSDGQSAWEHLLLEPAGYTIISDYWMPRLGGDGLFTHLLADPPLARNQRFILMTAAGRVLPATFLEQLRQHHAVIMRKPFEIDEVLKVVANAPFLEIL